MSPFFTKARERVVVVWQRAKPYGKHILSGLLLLLIAALGISLLNQDDKDTEKNPEVSQVYEPSISTPLPPDINPDAQPDASTTTEPSPEVASDNTNNESLTAPHTGIDDDEPVYYTNDELKFAAELPPKTGVKETSDGIIFSSVSGQTYYAVSTSPAGRETLQTIKAQLQNSPGVNNITDANLDGWAALRFSSYTRSGIAFIKDGTIYYIVGQLYLETFHTI
jgi:hypothetical protein